MVAELTRAAAVRELVRRYLDFLATLCLPCGYNTAMAATVATASLGMASH